MKWISIQDTLPDFEKPVLVCNAKTQINSTTICRLDSVVTNKAGIIVRFLRGRASYDEFSSDVTHWMELPEMPKL